jgi:hypothetical protein
VKDFFRSIISGIVTFRRQILLLVGFFVLLLVIVNVAYLGLSRSEKTCLVCHYLQPYYNLWSKSSHQDVGCITCHPDRQFLMGGYALRYITASYTANPIAAVKDESCLKCHEGQALDTEESFEGRISFNHNLHLEKPVRGIQLHCMTCHNHRTPGSYLQVDHQVCSLCHFKGAQRGQSQTGCQTCHGNPKGEVEHQGFQFNHQAYIDVGINCGQCHIDVVKGDASVPEEACYSCHVARLEKFKDFTLIHENHVHRREINCFQCHSSIEHGKFGMISSLEVRCETCHLKLHTPEKQLYIGSGGLGLADEPSRMFLAQVSCDGCHVKEEAIGEVEFGAAARKARRESCLACHGKGYELMLDDWLKATPEMLAAVEPHLKQAEALVANAQRQGRDVAHLQAKIRTARHNFDLVKDARMSHNVFYAISLLNDIASQAGEIRAALGGGQPASDLGPLLAAPGGYCNTLCHSRIARPDVITYEKSSFPHQIHSQDLDLPCTQCHPADKHRQKVIERQSCQQCHHQDYPISCAKCHWRQDELYRGQSADLNLTASPDPMAAAQIGCDGCHDLSKPHSRDAVAQKCADCHDADYSQMLNEWAIELDLAGNQLAAELDSAGIALKAAQGVGRKVWDESQAIEEIRKRAEFLASAMPLHNYAASSDAYAALRQKLAEVQARLKPAQ